jgi:alpha-glucosidase (family GH31 glycosyl hydrolase)
MNEPSNFCNGEYPIGCRTVIGPPYSENSTDIPLPDQQEMVRWGMYVLQESNRTASLPFIAPTPLSNPPFIPGAASWGVKSLNENTLTMDARQNLSSLHYNSHSLYGYFESIATLKAMENIRRKRPFLLSRSTFVGSGKYTAHWTGDNTASFESMKVQIRILIHDSRFIYCLFLFVFLFILFFYFYAIFFRLKHFFRAPRFRFHTFFRFLCLRFLWSGLTFADF